MILFIWYHFPPPTLTPLELGLYCTYLSTPTPQPSFQSFLFIFIFMVFWPWPWPPPFYVSPLFCYIHSKRSNLPTQATTSFETPALPLPLPLPNFLQHDNIFFQQINVYLFMEIKDLPYDTKNFFFSFSRGPPFFSLRTVVPFFRMTDTTMYMYVVGPLRGSFTSN